MVLVYNFLTFWGFLVLCRAGLKRIGEGVSSNMVSFVKVCRDSYTYFASESKLNFSLIRKTKDTLNVSSICT